LSSGSIEVTTLNESHLIEQRSIRVIEFTRIFDMVQFRSIKKESAEPSDNRSISDSKLSFTKLARNQTKKTVKDDLPVDTKPEQIRMALYEKVLLYLEQVLFAIKNHNEFSLEPGFEIINRMVEFDLPQDQLFLMAIHLDHRLRFVIQHSVNVAIYAVKMADDLKFSKDEQIKIGMAGLLHDIGMAAIPDEITNKEDKLTKEELKIIRERSNYSYDILKSFGHEYAYLAESALQVNERIDGSGYPSGLKGDEIHEYAQIIGLLDTYEALIHSRPHRQKFTHFMAIKKIINTSKYRFKRKHLKSLLDTFSIFPVHSYVRLNSEAIGKVIETYPNQPLRPKVQIVFDSQMQKVSTQRIASLAENPLLYIVDSVTEEEVKQIAEMQ